MFCSISLRGTRRSDTTADSVSNFNLTVLPGLGTSSFFGTATTIAVGNSTAEFRAYVQREIDRWGEVIKATGIKIK